MVKMIEGTATLFDMTGTQCTPKVSILSPQDFNLSPFQNDFISIQDILFKRYDNPIQGIPNNLAEVLCRDDFLNPKFEIVAHYDREKSAAVARVYSYGMIENDFSVSRLLSNTDVHYVSDRLSFSIDFSKMAQGTKRYAGAVQKTTSKNVTSQSLTCVIGGSLDTSNWAFQTLSDKEVDTFQVLPTGEVEFTSPIVNSNNTSIFKLFHINNDLVTTDITKNLFQSNESIWSNMFVGDGHYSAFLVSNPNEYGTSWYVWDKTVDKITRLTNLNPNAKLDEWEANIYTTQIAVTLKQQILYSTFKHPPSEETILRMYDPSDEKVHALFHSPRHFGFLLLPKSNQILIGSENKNSTLEKQLTYQLYDIQTKILRDVPIQVPSGCRLSAYRAKPLKNEKSFLELLLCSNAPQNRSVEIDLLTGEITSLIDNKLINLVFPNDDWLLASADMGITPSALVNRLSHQQIKTPIYSNYTHISEDENAVYGLGGSLGEYRLYRADLKTGQNNLVCDLAAGQRMALIKSNDQRLYLLTYDDNRKIYHVYFVKNGSECPRINEFPSIYNSPSGFTANKIGFSLNLSRPEDNFKVRESVFVPIDGRPPMKLSTNTSDVWQLSLSQEKNKIFILGPGEDGKRRLRTFKF